MARTRTLSPNEIVDSGFIMLINQSRLPHDIATSESGRRFPILPPRNEAGVVGK